MKPKKKKEKKKQKKKKKGNKEIEYKILIFSNMFIRFNFSL